MRPTSAAPTTPATPAGNLRSVDVLASYTERIASDVKLMRPMKIVVDCGNGVGRQYVSAGLKLKAIRNIFITHQHSDHNADYGTLLLLAWATDLTGPVDTWGPPPLAAMTTKFLELYDYDIRTLIADEGRPPLAPMIHPHELTEGGLVMQDANVKVTSALVKHPPVSPAFAFRFDAADRSIVISGDTAPSENLVRLAYGADVLVHEVMHLPSLDKLLSTDEVRDLMTFLMNDEPRPKPPPAKLAAPAKAK